MSPPSYMLRRGGAFSFITGGDFPIITDTWRRFADIPQQCCGGGDGDAT
jgi:hypothetical protein